MSAYLDFTRYSLAVNLLFFAGAAALVWAAGTRISRYADQIRERTGLGEAVLGLVLLGGVTSLPEFAVTISSAYAGNASLAVNNVLGGVAMQVAILAAADAAIGRDALTSVVSKPGSLLQGTLNIVLLAIVAAGTVASGTMLFGVGSWSWAVLLAYLLAVWLLVRGTSRRQWVPAKLAPGHEDDASDASPHAATSDRAEPGRARLGLRLIVLKTAVAAAVILAAGFVLSRTGESIAVQTGLGSSFVGAVFVAISTSLPEVSTVLAAVRLRRYEMAISDIFGTNLFDVALVFVIDAVYVGNAVLADAGPFATTAALLGIIVTALYLAGLIERRDRTVFRMGVDSLAVLVIYLAGLVLLYGMRQSA